MGAADKLIVALDAPDERANTELFLKLYDADVSWFKIGLPGLIAQGNPSLARRIVDYRANLFLDLKLYDTRDTVDRAIRVAFNRVGARFVTVHATSSVMEAGHAREAGWRLLQGAGGWFDYGPRQRVHKPLRTRASHTCSQDV